jgi:hypothetical protein
VSPAPPVHEAAPARRGPPERRDAAAIFALALALRLAVAAWACGRFPPAADGVYYERVAERIAAGFGYTWLWPDGVVTYAAHYPVGYPGALGALYAVFGASPLVAMSLNATLGALAAMSAHRLAFRAGSRWQALAAGALVALHPALLLYTPAIMTEGVTAALVTVAAALAGEARAHDRPAARRGLLLAMAVVVGAATLVRPQSVVFAPLFTLLAFVPGKGLAPFSPKERSSLGPPIPRSTLSRLGALPLRAFRLATRFLLTWRLSLGGRAVQAAGVAGIVALLVCAPWTARNCARMKRCALVSVNGGWNLLIGADEAATGAWAPIKVPVVCREVYDEADKDACFGREAQRFIAERPFAWLALAPKKLAATFDYSGAPGYYLHASNPAAFDEHDKTALGVVETLFERVALVAAIGVASRASPTERPARARRYARLALGAFGAVAGLTLHAFLGYLAFGLLGLRWASAPGRAAFLLSAAAAVVLATALTHAVFFGAGRYAMVVFPLLTAIAPLAVPRAAGDDRHRASTLL